MSRRLPRVIPGEASGEFRAWSFPRVETDAGAGDELADERAVAEPPPPGPSAEEIERLREAARREGHAEGLAQGLAEGRARLEEQIAALAALLDALASPLASVDAEVEEDLARLALDVGSTLARRALAEDVEALRAVLREALAMLPAAAREVRVHLHPDDAVLLDAEGAETRRWTLVPNATLARGDCRIESDMARVDASLEARRRNLLDALAEPAPGDDRGSQAGDP